MQLNQEQVKLVYKALLGKKSNEEPFSAVKLDGSLFPVQLSPRTRCRYIRIGDLKFIVQNPNSDTDLAQQVKAGDVGIVHVIPTARRGPWGMIMNGEIVKSLPEIGEA